MTDDALELSLTEADHAHFRDVDERYRRLHTDPEGCRPMIIIHPPVPGLPTWEERLADPRVMLRAELATLPRCGHRPEIESKERFVALVRDFLN